MITSFQTLQVLGSKCNAKYTYKKKILYSLVWAMSFGLIRINKPTALKQCKNMNRFQLVLSLISNFRQSPAQFQEKYSYELITTFHKKIISI